MVRLRPTGSLWPQTDLARRAHRWWGIENKAFNELTQYYIWSIAIIIIRRAMLARNVNPVIGLYPFQRCQRQVESGGFLAV